MDEKALREKLKDCDPYVRRDACEEVAASRSREYIPDIVATLKDSDPAVKEAAMNALTSIGGKDAADGVAPLLRSDDASQRNIAIEIMELIGGAALETISELLKDDDDDVIKFAVDILANIRQERAVNMLSGLTDHRNPNVRASVAVCLGRLKGPGVLQQLLKTLNDPEEWVRFSCIEGLGLLHDPASLRPLLEIIEKDTGFLVREAAIEAVSKIATGAESADILLKLEPLIKKGRVINVCAVVELMEKALCPGSAFKPSAELKGVFFEFLLDSLNEGEKPDQMKALKGLGLLKMREALPAIFSFASSMKEIDEDTEALLVDTVIFSSGRGALPQILRDEIGKGGKNLRIAVKALAGMRSEEAVPILEELMQRVAKHELREVVAALEAIGSIHSVEVLRQSLKSSDGHTRKIAARAIGSLAGESAVGDLFSVLRGERYRDVMEEITDVVSLIPSDTVKKGFCELLSSNRDEMREMAARGLGIIGDEEALRFLKEAVKDPSLSVRKTVYNSIARLGIPGSEELIVKGLRDEDDDVKLAVLKSLDDWTGAPIREALIEALNDKNIWVRYHSVLLLGDIGGTACEDSIINMLMKDEAPVKAAAAKALERLGSSKAVPALERFLDHPDPSVRSAVENAIGALNADIRD